MRPIKAALAAMTLLVIALPASAGNYVTLSCEDGSFSREYMIGTGRQIRGQGLELWPMLCTATNKFGLYPRVANPQRFAQLEELAKRKVPDKAEVRSVLALGEEVQRSDMSDLFAQAEELTFGDIRSTVANTARDTGEPVGGHHDFWQHPACAGKLIPYDYYQDADQRCPACGDGRLMVDTENRTEWE